VKLTRWWQSRFETLFAALSAPRSNETSREHWTDPAGRRAVTIQRSTTRTTFTFDERLQPKFGQYVADHLDKLFSEFRAGEGEGGT
jgi:ParB family chromosome partitioning protein